MVNKAESEKSLKLRLRGDRVFNGGMRLHSQLSYYTTTFFRAQAQLFLRRTERLSFLGSVLLSSALGARLAAFWNSVPFFKKSSRNSTKSSPTKFETENKVEKLASVSELFSSFRVLCRLATELPGKYWGLSIRPDWTTTSKTVWISSTKESDLWKPWFNG